MKNFKIDVFLKKREYILWSTFEQKTTFLVIYKPKTAGNHPFFHWYHIFQSAWGCIWLRWHPPPPPPDQALPPTNSQCTKRILSRPHGLLLFLSESAELPTTAAAWRKGSLSPIGCLGGPIWLLAPRQHQFIWPPRLGLKVVSNENKGGSEVLPNVTVAIGLGPWCRISFSNIVSQTLVQNTFPFSVSTAKLNSDLRINGEVWQNHFRAFFLCSLRCANTTGDEICTPLKGIVSRDWEQIQWIPSDRSEECRVAGAYFFPILMSFSCLNSKNACFGGFSFDSYSANDK